MSRLLVFLLCAVLLVACGAPAQPSAADLQATVQAQVQATLTAQQAQAPTPSPSPIAPTPTTQIGFNPSPGGSPMDMGAPSIEPSLPQPTATLIPAEPLTVEGTPIVLSNTYSTGEIQYQVVVAFQVRNPNTHVAARNVPYRVTLKAGDETLATSDNERIEVAAGATRLVVTILSGASEVTTQPDAADVQIYSDPSLFVPASEVPNADQWTIENVSFECPEGQIGCDAIGDITWTGDTPQQAVTLYALARQGDTPIGAGVGSPEGSTIAPNQTVPFRVLLIGFPQAEPAKKTELPAGDIVGEFSVTSYDSLTP